MATQVDNVFEFIKYTKATQSVSLKVLQKFVLSLDKIELQHMVTFYLRSILKKSLNHDVNGLTLSQARHRLLIEKNDSKSNNSSTIDQQIINKIQKNYGNKYNKKMIKKLQQHHDENKHLLSITPQILASTFQYLSFRELCKVQATCSYFIYLKHNMNGQCNYFINLDDKFWHKAMKCQIPFNVLTKFKHIGIKSMYYGKSSYCNVTTKRRIFDHILKAIIKSSRISLQRLEINITSSHGRRWGVTPHLCLYQIMNECECDLFPKLSSLIWRHESYMVSTLTFNNDINIIKDNLFLKMPSLNNFSICR